MDDEARRVVRAGYEQVAAAYDARRPRDGADVAWLDDVIAAVGRGGRVLDAGCGAGEPVATRLLAAGLAVVGVDCAAAPLRLARRLTGPLTLVQGDLAALPLPDASVDGVVSFYAVIHVPRDDHRRVFAELHRVLRPDGVAVLCLGARDLPADRDDTSWLGAPMFWSHFDAETNGALLEDAGLAVERAARVPDPMGHGEHLFVTARRR